MEKLKSEAKDRDLWALGHPKEIGGGGLAFMPFTYLTRSYTRKQQEETNIRYLTPQTFRLPPGVNTAGKTFCRVVQEAMPGAALAIWISSPSVLTPSLGCATTM